MKTFSEYLVEMAKGRNLTKPLLPIQIIVKLLNVWFTTHKGLHLKRVEHETEDRHENQVRIHLDMCPNDPDKEMASLNRTLTRGVKFIESISKSVNSGSESYDTWTIRIKALDAIKKSDLDFASVNALFEAAFGIKGAPIQMNAFFSSSLKEFEMVYTIPTKGRKKDKDKPKLKPKDFVPDEFGFQAGEPYTLAKLLNAIEAKMNDIRKARYALFSKYISEVVSSLSGMPFKGAVSPNALDIADIASKDVDVINKNFGEVLCAISLLRSMGGAVTFPSSSNEAVYDFTFFPAAGGLPIKYSVKNKRGSKGTAISSIKEMISFYEDTIKEAGSNASFPKDFAYFKDVMLNLADKTDKSKHTQDKLVAAALLMAKRNASGYCAKVLKYVNNAMLVLGQKTIYNGGFKAAKEVLDMAKSMKQDDSNEGRQYHKFIAAMKDMTANCVMLPSGKSDDTEDLVQRGKYGVIVYPIGKALCNDLNNDAGMLECLNAVLNAKDNIVQINTQISISQGKLIVNEPKQTAFKLGKFIFDYNGYRSNSGTNRPLGYKMTKR